MLKIPYILNYTDPGSGFVFAQGTAFLWAIILGLMGGFFVFARFFFKFIKRFFWLLIIIIVIIISSFIFIMGGMMREKPLKKKVIILGIDAMEPKITQKLMEEGKLPNFSLLKKMGVYSSLETTYPPESIVAWTSFATGSNPGYHSIFDFIMRDPLTYLPFLAFNEISTVAKNISWGRIEIPLNKLEIKMRRKVPAFWNILSENKIPNFVFFFPNTFPPEKTLGKMISGMGVPDLYGTMGRFSFYTSVPLSREDTRGKIVQVRLRDNVINTHLYGPRLATKTDIIESSIPLKIILYPSERKVRIEIQKNHLTLHESNWSDWQRVAFQLGPFKKGYGIVRFYLKNIQPEFGLYCSPVNFDPERPIFAISYPRDFSGKISKKIGLYYTQGMPHDTWALNEGYLDEKAFLEHADTILEDNRKVLLGQLRNFKQGLFMFYFETLDIIQHMFWRYLDPKHPLYQEGSAYKDTIFKYYEKMDRILGEVLDFVDEDTILIVISDHGFNSFRRAVHLNSWLRDNGFLFLKKGSTQSKEFFEDVDWSRTKAYAVGFGGIYINRLGREKYGIVKESEVEELKKVISEGLKKWRDAVNQELIAKEVYLSEKIYGGPYINEGPDLLVGFNAGYRASWQNALGGIPEVLIEDNRKKWSGEHLIDPSLVPGVIFINRKVELSNPNIMDIVATILGIYKIDKPAYVQGKKLL